MHRLRMITHHSGYRTGILLSHWCPRIHGYHLKQQRQMRDIQQNKLKQHTEKVRPITLKRRGLLNTSPGSKPTLPILMLLPHQCGSAYLQSMDFQREPQSKHHLYFLDHYFFTSWPTRPNPTHIANANPDPHPS